jgi:3-ketosteroid 9alpha-monooxygenase subunit A
MQFYVDRGEIPPSIADKHVYVTRRREDTRQWVLEEHGFDLDRQDPVRIVRSFDEVQGAAQMEPEAATSGK